MSTFPSPPPGAAPTPSAGLSLPSSNAPASAPSRLARLRRYRLLWGLAITVFALDQATKLWIDATLPFPTYGPPNAIVVIDGFFNLVHVGNTGAAWSMFAGQSLWLAMLALVTLGAIFWWRHSLELRHRTGQLAFGLLCGGIVGNLVDRLFYGYVIDFLDFQFGSYFYPTFNLADSGICVGVGVYLVHSLRSPPAPVTPPAAT